MDPISNADRLVLLLRQKLEERAKLSRAARTEAPSKSEAQDEAAAPTGVRALAGIDGVDERQLRRAIIQQLLADEFDSDLLNAAQFQQIVSRVTETLEEDEQASRLFGQVIAALKAS